GPSAAAGRRDGPDRIGMYLARAAAKPENYSSGGLLAATLCGAQSTGRPRAGNLSGRRGSAGRGPPAFLVGPARAPRKPRATGAFACPGRAAAQAFFLRGRYR